MKIFFTLVMAIVFPILLAVALAYEKNHDPQPETVTLEEFLKSLD